MCQPLCQMRARMEFLRTTPFSHRPLEAEPMPEQAEGEYAGGKEDQRRHFGRGPRGCTNALISRLSFAKILSGAEIVVFARS